MKYIVRIILFSAILVLSGMSCWEKAKPEEVVPVGEADPVGEPAAVITQPAEELWKEFSTIEGGFSILMPGEVVVTRQTVPTWVGALDEFSFNCVYEGVGYEVRYHDYELADVYSYSPMVFLDSVVIGEMKEGEVVYEQMISIARHPGRRIKTIKPEGQTFTSEVYLARERLYKITVMQPSDTTPAETDKFMASFKLL